MSEAVARAPVVLVRAVCGKHHHRLLTSLRRNWAFWKRKKSYGTKKKVTVKTSAGNLVRLMFKRAPKVIPDCFGFVCSSLCDWSKKNLALPSQPIRSTNQTKIDHFSVTLISRLPVLFFPLLIDWCCYFRLVYPHLILCALSFLEFLSTNNCNNNTNKAFVSP